MPESRHLPLQDAGRATFHSYNSDDTLASVTGARGEDRLRVRR